MSVGCLAFTEKGYALAQSLAKELGGTADRSCQPLTLSQWTAIHFEQDRALVYVGAVGIAVRAIAPHLRSKTIDPAVVAVDECARFAVPLVSGHLGGANDLARKVALLCGAQPVITTATDVNGVFAVDEWARCQNCAVVHPQCIRSVSGKLLAGCTVRIKTEVPIAGQAPQGIELATEEPYDVYVGLAPQPDTVLWLVPRIVVLGVGCKKGTTQQSLQAAFASFPVPLQSVYTAASIDLKAAEPGLLSFCKIYGWNLQTYPAAKLQGVEGAFSSSDFVKKTTGVDNVCERAAVLCSGGTLLHGKQAGNGVTLAAAVKHCQLDWSFHNEW